MVLALLQAAHPPNRILLACIKFLAQCPCPTCLVLKKDIRDLGTKHDERTRTKKSRTDNEEFRWKISHVRKYIYEQGVHINGKWVDSLLGPESLVPTRVGETRLITQIWLNDNQNAFSAQLSEHGFNFYSMFVPDLLHEFELGVWKAIFTHLVRILNTKPDLSLTFLNERCVLSVSY